MSSRAKKNTVKVDSVYPDMYRVHWSDGVVSDMVNITRARDAVQVYEANEARDSTRRVGIASTEPAGAFK